MTTSDFNIILYTCVSIQDFFSLFSKIEKPKIPFWRGCIDVWAVHFYEIFGCLFFIPWIFLWVASKLLSGFLSVSFRTNLRKKPYECRKACMIPQRIEDSVMNLSVWILLSCVPWMAGFTPIEDTEKHWFFCKRDNSLLFSSLNQGLELDRALNQTLIEVFTNSRSRF